MSPPIPQHRVALSVLGPPTFGGLALYDWDPADLSASPVDSWTSKSSQLTLTAAGSARPEWLDAGGAQSLAFPCVHWDGVDDVMVSAGSQALDWSDFTCFIVKERITTATNEGPYYHKGDGASATQGRIETLAAAAGAQMYWTTNRAAPGTLGYFLMNDAALQTTDAVVWSARLDDTLLATSDPDACRQNEVNVTNSKSGSVGALDDVDIVEHGHGYNAAKWNAYEYRRLYYTGGKLTDAQTQEVEDYLRNTYFGGAY